MELSYAAYNPVEYEAIPGVPSSFMQAPYDDETRTAEFELESVGFDATAYNYNGGYLGYAAHTIGHRNIIDESNQETGGNNNDTSSNVATVVGSIEGTSIYIPVAGSNTGKIIRNTIESDGSVSEIDETLSENVFLQIKLFFISPFVGANCVRPLILYQHNCMQILAKNLSGLLQFTSSCFCVGRTQFAPTYKVR